MLSDEGNILVPGTMNGNIFMTVQPARQYGMDPTRAYHDTAIAPTHQYLAFYYWLREVFKADAVIHLGTHGNLEWLPGKAVGLDEGSFPDIALGNIIGSNIFNTLLILGLTALLMPIGITNENRKRDIPMNILITVLLLALGLSKMFFGIGENNLSRIEGGILVAIFVVYMVFSFKQGTNNGEASKEEKPEEGHKEPGVFLSLLMIVGGLAALIFGGDKFVDSATWIAETAGLSEKFIAITILAGGTSLPELATCIVAAAKKKGQLALGNILGSNIFNILLILGGSAMICPLSMANINLIDAGVLFLSSILVLLASFLWDRNKIDRIDASTMLICYVAYMTWLFMSI